MPKYNFTNLPGNQIHAYSVIQLQSGLDELLALSKTLKDTLGIFIFRFFLLLIRKWCLSQYHLQYFMDKRHNIIVLVTSRHLDIKRNLLTTFTFSLRMVIVSIFIPLTGIGSCIGCEGAPACCLVPTVVCRCWLEHLQQLSVKGKRKLNLAAAAGPLLFHLQPSKVVHLALPSTPTDSQDCPRAASAAAAAAAADYTAGIAYNSALRRALKILTTCATKYICPKVGNL